MNNDWLKNIRDKMSDFEVEEPQGLWDDINLARKRKGAVFAAVNAKGGGMPLWKRITVAAAMIGVAVSIGWLAVGTEPYDVNPDPSAPMSDGLSVAMPDNRDGEPAGPDPEIGMSSCVNISSASRVSTFKMPQSNTMRLIEACDSAHAAPEDVGSTLTTTADNKTFVEKNVRDSIMIRNNNIGASGNPRADYGHNLVAVANVPDGGKRKVSIGVFSTGGIGSEINSRSDGSAVAAGVGPENSGWEDSPMLGILAYNRGKDIVNDVKHHLPVRVGLSIAYRFNSRLSIESGISYSNLVSDIFQGSENHYLSERQSLHYIGVPVGIRCDIVSWNGFELYASGGVMMEKCVSGSLRNGYVLDDKNVGDDIQKIEERPLQWSVNASAGLQYNIFSFLGVYAEPGVCYYFDDNSGLNTIYKDKPLNFNLNFGIRLTIGN